MKAALCRRYGAPETVVIEDLPRPRPGPGEVLIAVAAAGLTSGDARIRAAQAPKGMGPLIRLAFGLTGPRQPVLGREYAGRVVETGAGAGRFAPGNAVFGITDGLRLGAHAEYLVVKESGLILPRPEHLDEIHAAAFFFGGLTAADFLIDQCALQPGERLLIVGATGAVGSAALQLARHIGAEVTALTSGANLALARDLGADIALDYRSGPVLGQYDVILDVPGLLPGAMAQLAPEGRLGLVTADLRGMLTAMLHPRRSGGRRLCAGIVKETPQAMNRLLAYFHAGAYRPVIGGEFPLQEIALAHAIAASGHKCGNLVITLAQDRASVEQDLRSCQP
jgi:NADPH:quinone reductase-like Zn-dependent oxidoreductase